MLPLLFNSPSFYRKRSAKRRRRASLPPADNADRALCNAGGAAVRTNGSLWAGNPNPLPFRAYQIWNEPALPVYWRDKPSATEYLSDAPPCGRRHQGR